MSCLLTDCIRILRCAGVVLAVDEVFGQISAWHGIWAMCKVGCGWQMVELY